MEVKESQVPVPWGHIAVKLWGDERNRAVLVIHGIMDNAGSFDRLIPLLPTNFFYICMDLPGHGQSSHMPANGYLNTTDNLFAYRAVTDFYARENYIILAHSYGGQLGTVFTQLYPERITKLISLDTIYLFPTTPGNMKSVIRNLHDTFINTTLKLSKNNPPEYTYEQALQKVTLQRRYGEITPEAAEPILKRMIVPLENGKIRFTIDQRLKFYLNPLFDIRYICEFMKKHPIKCPHLIICARDSDVQQLYFKKIIQQMDTNKKFRMKLVEGSHDVHNVHPERVAPLINKFLLYEGKTSKL